MTKLSAGILLYRRKNGQVEVLLVHPGGPFWAKKNLGAWGLAKGEFTENEDPLIAAKREFKEELGRDAPEGTYIDLGLVKIPSKTIHGWAVEADFDPAHIISNMIEIEWPPRSGQKMEIPEVDKAEWFSIDRASERMHKGQPIFIERLAEKLSIEIVEPPEQASLF